MIGGGRVFKRPGFVAFRVERQPALSEMLQSGGADTNNKRASAQTMKTAATAEVSECATGRALDMRGWGLTGSLCSSVPLRLVQTLATLALLRQR